MISICITVKNRSRVKTDKGELQLFPKCIKSVASVNNEIPCEIIVSDWGSDDWPLPLAQWLSEAVKPIHPQIIQVEGGFSRGRGLNVAAEAAKGDQLFFTDADCLFSPKVFLLGSKYIDEGKAFFPVVYSFADPEHKTGWWRHEGFGNCMISKKAFELTGGWPQYNVWGKEDDDFYAKVKGICGIVREEVPGFFHQWHPNDVIWKNQHSAHAKEIAEEVEQVAIAKQELIKVIATGETLILVDESRFGDDGFISDAYIVPFTEVKGEYGGPPVDNQAAIMELERLQLNGASFIAFTWISFWWLEHYDEFYQYLKKFKCIFKSDRLLIFNLRNSTPKQWSPTVRESVTSSTP
jgi:glycosyltransferase involved in cell wall biosynthesis